jgi:hypothetical protein
MLLIIVGGVKLMHFTGNGTPATAEAAVAPVPVRMVEMRPPPQEDVPTPTRVASKPAPTKAIASRMRMPAPRSATPPVSVAAPARATEPLGGAYIDEHHGFSMRFPSSWSVRTFAGNPWVLDCADGPAGIISIGFSPFPIGFTADSISPDAVARRIKRLPDTTLHTQGYATIDGRKSLWSKSTGPVAMSTGAPRMTRVNYIVPLNDGRVMELRLAATPDRFEQLMPTMRAAVASFKVMPLRKASVTVRAAGR